MPDMSFSEFMKEAYNIEYAPLSWEEFELSLENFVDYDLQAISIREEHRLDERCVICNEDTSDWPTVYADIDLEALAAQHSIKQINLLIEELDKLLNKNPNKKGR